VVERVLTEGCFVGEVFTSGDRGDYVDVDDWPVGEEERDDLHRVEALALRRRYSASSSATDIRFSIPPEAGASRDLGSGTLVVPGWIRERAAEVLFEEDDFGETTGLPDLVLGCLLKVSCTMRACTGSYLLFLAVSAAPLTAYIATSRPPPPHDLGHPCDWRYSLLPRIYPSSPRGASPPSSSTFYRSLGDSTTPSLTRRPES